jgi:hypothetical protein
MKGCRKMAIQPDAIAPRNPLRRSSAPLRRERQISQQTLSENRNLR